MENKDTYVSPAERFLLTLHAHQGITARRILENGYIDEGFFRKSFKRDHKKSKTFTMPRKAHKRGVKGS